MHVVFGRDPLEGDGQQFYLPYPAVAAMAAWSMARVSNVSVQNQ
jgi:hypothetical protein